MVITRVGIQFVRENYRGLLSFLGLVAIWQGLVLLKITPRDLLPSPTQVFATALYLIRDGGLGHELGRSFVRVLKGVGIGISTGFLLGTAMGLSRTAEKLFGPFYHGMRQVPLLGWIPLIILWCGLADLSKIVFIAIGAFYPMVLNTYEGIRGVPREYVEVVRTFEYGRFRLLTRVILPAALPNILTGVRMSLGVAWMLVVGAEIFTRTDGGIGDMIWVAREKFRMDEVIVGVVAIGLCGFLINEAVRLLETRLIRWRRTYR